MYFLLPLLILVDQATKYFASNFFKISCNDGIAFGLKFFSTDSGNFSTLISALVIIYLLYLLISRRYGSWTLGLVLIAGGGLSNLLDRIVIGCVRDFINLPFFASINLADVSISAGVLIILLKIFKVEVLKNK